MKFSPDRKLFTLYINGPSHWCGRCGLDADPFELRHRTIPSRIVQYGGCNTRWLYTSTEAGTDGEQRARAIRPDLEFWR